MRKRKSTPTASEFALWFVFMLVVGLWGGSADATSPTKDPEKQTPAPTAGSASAASANANATQGQSQNTTLAPEQSVSVSETSIGIGLGAGSAHYTGGCVVPKKGRNGRTGFLERGFTVPLLRLDPAVEVDEVCVSHQREMERLALEIERERIELERERLQLERIRLEECVTCGAAK